jgi:hypothetical protein
MDDARRRATSCQRLHVHAERSHRSIRQRTLGIPVKNVAAFSKNFASAKASWQNCAAAAQP